ncbi:MAG: 50S ribosomal protein L15 [Acidobacteriota bacterium]
MDLETLAPSPGAKKKRKRIGRGEASGQGGTAGRGHKGQKSRSGFSRRPGFEGGQMPLQRRVPKRGFTNIFRKEVTALNVQELAKRFEAGATVGPEELREKGLLRKSARLKILGEGKLEGALTVKAHAFSASARSKIEAAGGSCELL